MNRTACHMSRALVNSNQFRACPLHTALAVISSNKVIPPQPLNHATTQQLLPLPPPVAHHLPAAMAVANPQSRLLALPRELRDIIYKYTFTASVDIKDNDIGDHNAGLLSACRQTRTEAAKLYYQRTVFQAIGFERQAAEAILARFLSSIPRQSLCLIQAIHVDVQVLHAHLFSGAFALLFHKFQRDEYEEMCRSLGLRLQKKFEGLREILQVKVLSWNGRENEEVWTSNPHGEEFPRF